MKKSELFADVKTCMTCLHLMQQTRAMSDRQEYICGRTETSAHDERRHGGSCESGIRWEGK